METVKSSVPFNEAIRFYLHIPLTEKMTRRKNYRAECPWCSTGRLSLDPVKKVGWCLDCGNGGDLLSIVCSAEKVTLETALENLIEKYDINGEACAGDECRSTGRAR